MEIFIDDRSWSVSKLDAQPCWNLNPDAGYVAWVMPGKRMDKLQLLEKAATVAEANPVPVPDPAGSQMLRLTNAMDLPAETSLADVLEAIAAMKQRNDAKAAATVSEAAPTDVLTILMEGMTRAMGLPP